MCSRAAAFFRSAAASLICLSLSTQLCQHAPVHVTHGSETCQQICSYSYRDCDLMGQMSACGPCMLARSYAMLLLQADWIRCILRNRHGHRMACQVKRSEGERLGKTGCWDVGAKACTPDCCMCFCGRSRTILDLNMGSATS